MRAAENVKQTQQWTLLGFIPSPQEALWHSRKMVFRECTKHASSASTPTSYASSHSFALPHVLFFCALTHPLPASACSLSFCTFQFFSAFSLSLAVALEGSAHPTADIWSKGFAKPVFWVIGPQTESLTHGDY